MDDFKSVIDDLRNRGGMIPPDRVQIKIPDADKILWYYLSNMLSVSGVTNPIHMQFHDSIAEWLSNNQGKGLFLYGSCGVGKTFIARYVIPAILSRYCGKIVSHFDMSDIYHNAELVLSKHIICLDDIGTEQISVDYGTKRDIVPEIFDSAEKRGKLVIATSNLDMDDIVRRYGTRTLERIKSTTKRIAVNGSSFRR